MDAKAKKYDQQEIAKRIRILRKINELSQGELAKRLGISQSMLSKYEKGKVGLTLETAVKYTEVFQRKINYIAFGEEV